MLKKTGSVRHFKSLGALYDAQRMSLGANWLKPVLKGAAILNLR
jgi:hypothetical protein